jgi:hypothetical protein
MGETERGKRESERRGIWRNGLTVTEICGFISEQGYEQILSQLVRIIEEADKWLIK